MQDTYTTPAKAELEFNQVKNMFLHEKPAKIAALLAEREDMYVKQISGEIDATYSHTVRLLDRMADRGIVESKKSGRKKKYRLTSRGHRLADGLADFFRSMAD